MAGLGESRGLTALAASWVLRLLAAVTALFVTLTLLACSSTPEASVEGPEAEPTLAVAASLTVEPQTTPTQAVATPETVEPQHPPITATPQTDEPQPTSTPAATTPETAGPQTTPTQAVATPETVETPTTETPTQVPSPTTPSPTTVPDIGGVARLAAKEAFEHQDVHDSWSPALSTWGPGLVYSRLLRLRSGPDVRLPSLVVECDLCAEWRMTDHLTFEFDLRPDAAWQDLAPVDGRQVTVADIAFSYTRQAEAGRPNAGLLRSIERIELLGDSSMRIRLKVADADFLTALADARSKIVAPEVVAENGDLRNGPTIGSGPWMLTSTRLDGSSMYERNPGYFESSLPYLDGLSIQVIEEDETRTAAFLTNVLDFHEFGPAEWNSLLDRRPNAPSFRVPQPGVGVELAMNLAAAPFDNAASRRTVFLATDPWSAIENVWGGQGFVSIGSPAGDAAWLADRQQIAPFFADPRGAAEALDEGPFSSFTIRVGDFGPQYIAHAETVVIELKDAGLDPRMELVNRRVFGEEVWTAGRYQMSIGPTAPATMPNSYLLPVLHSNGVRNSASIHDPELDALIEAQATEYDPALRRDLFRQIQALVFEKAYRFMPATRVSVWSWTPNVRNFYPNFGGFEYHHWAEVWLVGGR